MVLATQLASRDFLPKMRKARQNRRLCGLRRPWKSRGKPAAVRKVL